jgi:hypothetical protein
MEAATASDIRAFMNMMSGIPLERSKMHHAAATHQLDAKYACLGPWSPVPASEEALESAYQQVLPYLVSDKHDVSVLRQAVSEKAVQISTLNELLAKLLARNDEMRRKITDAEESINLLLDRNTTLQKRIAEYKSKHWSWRLFRTI